MRAPSTLTSESITGEYRRCLEEGETREGRARGFESDTPYGEDELNE
jgi:hypothetical protein